MATRNLIQYNQTPDQHFFLCRQCNTHIARTQEFVFRDIMIEAGIFNNNVVNVKVDAEEKHCVEANATVADVYCLGCNQLLGQNFIAVEKENLVLKQGRYKLQLTKLLMWDGNNMLYADTFEPIKMHKSAAV